MTTVVLEAAARSAALIVLVWLTLAVLRPRNPHLHKVLWTSVVVTSLAMPLLMQIQLLPAIAAPTFQWTLRPHGATLSHAVGLQPLSACLYLVPAAFLLWRLVNGWRRLWRIRRSAEVLRGPWTDGLDVRVSGQIPTPAAFGTTVLLPKECTTWSPTKLAAVVAHENAHVLHRDCYMLWLARLSACVFWFNPLAWWVARRLAALAEQTSDDAAIETLGSRTEYAEILLSLGTRRTSELAAAMAARSNLSMRIERILSNATLSRALRHSQRTLVIAAVLPAVAVAAAPLQSVASAALQGGRASSSLSATASMEPRVVSWGPLDSYYPPEAKKKDVEGLVELAITLDREGRATDTQILTEDPLDMGFGAAASAAVHAMQYSNPTGRPVTFTLRVRFALTP
jgi:TonB family protein